MMELQRASMDVTQFGHNYKKGEFLPFYIPRLEMPQVDEKDMSHLIAMAYLHRYNPAIEVVNPKTLRAHQRVDINRAITMPLEIKLKPALVSIDNFVLDGNHRWWAHVHAGDEAMNIVRIGLAFDKAIDWLFKQPFVYSIKPTTPIRN
jgi:hypothetical protein